MVSCMKIIGKQLQDNFLCSSDPVFAAGGRDPIQWRNDDSSTCPEFGIFEVIDYDVDPNSGEPLIIGIQPNPQAGDQSDDHIYGFNLNTSVAGGGGYGCCRFDMPLVAAIDSSVAGVGEVLGPEQGSWVLHSEGTTSPAGVGGKGFLSLGPDNNGKCLIREQPANESDATGGNRFAITNVLHNPINPNVIAGVDWIKYEFEDPVNCSGILSPCVIHWMWAGYMWIGFEAISHATELHLAYMPEHQPWWDCIVPTDNPDNPNLPRNFGPWFIVDGSCPNLAPPGGYSDCIDPPTSRPAPSGQISVPPASGQA